MLILKCILASIVQKGPRPDWETGKQSCFLFLNLRMCENRQTSLRVGGIDVYALIDKGKHVDEDYS